MYNRKLVFAAACLGMLMFGIVLTTLGAILPSVIEKYGVDKANAGSLVLLMTFGILVGSLTFGPIVDRYGYKYLLIVCAALILLGLEGISFASSFWFLRLSVVFFGLGGGVINGGTNALVADISQEKKGASLSLLGVFFGIGAMGVPFVIWRLSNVLSYEVIIAGVGLIVILPLLFFGMVRFPSPKQAQGFPIRQGVGLLKELTLFLFAVFLFFESGMEITVGSWAAVFLKDELAIDASRAVLVLAFYWLGMMSCRLALSQLLKSVSAATVLLSCIGLAFVGALVMIFSNSLALGIPGLVLLGVGLAAGFPVILGYVGDIYSELSGTAFSIAFAIALLGGMTLPALTGVVADSQGLRLAFALVPFGLCCQVALFLVVIQRVQRVSPKTQPPQ